MSKHEAAVDRPHVANLLRAYDLATPGKYTDLREQHAQQTLNPHSIGRHHTANPGRSVLALIRRLSLEHPERDYLGARASIIASRHEAGLNIARDMYEEEKLQQWLHTIVEAA